MPFKYKKKRSFRRKKPVYRQMIRFKRYAGSIRSNPNTSLGIHWFKRSLNAATENGAGFSPDGTVVTVNSNNVVFNTSNIYAAGTTVYGTMTYYFSIQNLPGLSDFTALFDNYQIRKVVVKITSYATESLVPPGAVAGVSWPGLSPILHYAIDHDDVTAPAAGESGIQELQQFASYKKARLIDSNKRPITIVIKPRTASSAYRAGAFNGYTENKRNTWLDCANTDIQNYGLKCVIEAVQPYASSYSVPMRIDTTYYLKFKGPR